MWICTVWPGFWYPDNIKKIYRKKQVMCYRLHHTISLISTYTLQWCLLCRRLQSSPLTPLISQCSYLPALPQCKYPHENNKSRGKPQGRILLFNHLVHRQEQRRFKTICFLRSLFGGSDTHLLLKKGQCETGAWLKYFKGWRDVITFSKLIGHITVKLTRWLNFP